MTKQEYIQQASRNVKSYPGMVDFILGCYHGHLSVNAANMAVGFNSLKYYGGDNRKY